MNENIKKLDLMFYCSENGVEPVRMWLKNQSKNDKKIIGEDLRTVQYGWPIELNTV